MPKHAYVQDPFRGRLSISAFSAISLRFQKQVLTGYGFSPWGTRLPDVCASSAQEPALSERSESKRGITGSVPSRDLEGPVFTLDCTPVLGTPSPQSSGMRRLRGKSRKIFDVKELIGKIFRTKNLASIASVLWGHARRFSLVYRMGGTQG